MARFTQISIDLETGRWLLLEDNNNSAGCNVVAQQATPAEIWTILHNKNSTKFIINIVKDGEKIIPNEVEVFDNNTIIVSFTSPTSGEAEIVFFECD